MSKRRQYVRLESSIPVMYWRLSEVEHAAPASATPTPSLTKNIGGIGVCVYVNEPLPNGARLRVQLRLPGQDQACAFIGEVAWCESTPAACRVGLKFVEIEPAQQAAIIRYCLRQGGSAPDVSSA
jgi:c-di-GMP-binding flagellar brake protein YcgR